jgi:uncharacterized protein
VTEVAVVQLFAVFHDSMRENEFMDPDHGMRGYNLAVQLGATKDLTARQQDQLGAACILHDSGMKHEDPTVGVCWDADRLDLPRVGITPNPLYFSTEAGVAEVREKWWT